MAMMQLFRKFRVWGVSITLFFFVTAFIPGQAKANPLALVPIALIGAALTGSALAGGSYYAPAVYDAAQLAASSAGNVARQVYYGQKFLNSVAGDYFYGKAVSLVANISGFLDYLESKAAQIPTLWAIVSGATSGDTVAPSNLPIYACASASNGLNKHLCAQGGEYTNGSYYAYLPGETYIAPAVSTFLQGAVVSGLCQSKYNQIAYALYRSDNNATYPFWICIQDVAANVCRQIYKGTTSPAISAPFDITQGEFDPVVFANNFIPSQGVTADIDTLANDSDSPPGFLTPADTAIPSEASGGVVTSPPAALSPTDINRGIEVVQADISLKAADTAQQIAATDPTNTVAQQNAADAARRAAEDALKAENEVPELPDISATSEPAYTLPEVDFAARFQIFLANIKSSSVFAVIDNLNLPIGTGQSLISFDFGSWGGVQSLDFADYADAWLILRGVFFAVFCFIATRIVILKR
jgi:hypothetical protein